MPTIWTHVYRMLPMYRLDEVRRCLRVSGAVYRIRYRGPHGPRQDTLRHRARAFTVYATFPAGRQVQI